MARRRRKKRLVTAPRTLLACAVITGCWLWLYRIDQPVEMSATESPTAGTVFIPPSPEPTRLMAQTPEDKLPPPVGEPVKPVSTPAPQVVESTTNAPAQPASAPLSPPAPSVTSTPPPAAAAPNSAGSTAHPTDPVRALIQKAQQTLSSGDVVGARSQFAAALAQDPNGPEADILREELSKIGEETILSPRILPGDPLVERYVIKDGDSLVKIAGQYLVSSDLLARINGIADKHRIRAGQALKVVKGPFRAEVSKSRFRLDLYVQDVLVKSFKVGLGADGSTPLGEWRVGTKLVNPTYYPPRGGDILSADDPTNPLGERWIGLIGVSGEALGQERYGIHGTIEPDSIGKNTSMGCIRLANSDVEWLYDFLVEKHGTVVVTE